MRRRLILRFLTPVVCFVAAWMIARAPRPDNASGGKVSRIQIHYNVTNSVARAGAVRRLAEAMTASNPGEWRALWDEFAATAGTEELTTLAVEGIPGSRRDAGDFPPLRALAWEELAVRMPEGFPDLVRRAATRDPDLVAAAAASLAARDPKAAWELLPVAASPKVRNAVLSSIAWNDPEQALRLCRTLPPAVSSVEDEGGPSAEEAVFITWARRDPKAAAEAVLAYPKDSKTPAAMLMTWARMDALAALDFAVQRLGGNDTTMHYRMDQLVMAALRQSPAEAVKRIAVDPVLLAVCERQGTERFDGEARAVWCDLAPESFIALLRAGVFKKEASELTGRAVAYVARRDPQAASELMMQLQPGELKDTGYFISEVAQHDAALGPPLAAHFGVEMPESRPLSQARYDPGSACDAWLAALEKHPAGEAASACGISPQEAISLVAFAMQEMPDKVQALAERVPWESMDIAAGGLDAEVRRDLRRLWHEPDPEAPAAPVISQDWLHAGGSDQLEADPAGCAAKLNRDALGDWDGWNAVVNWAPHDFEAASAWVKSLPAGEARDRAEVGLALELSVRDPEAALRILAEAPSSALWPVNNLGARAWLSAVQDVMFAGGDWEGWLRRTPPVLREEVEELKAGVFDREAELLEALRQTK
jgi:hypothetical protein